MTLPNICGVDLSQKQLTAKVLDAFCKKAASQMYDMVFYSPISVTPDNTF